ncbi:MAG: hypothetical protein MAG431_01295 [Chloroflexi bacterium]|nr:hypothetical protein [Chloroflexota bacterium]
MKTQIIQLESHDETISVKDKIEWSQTHRVLLLWPRRGKILREQLDLVSLERHCAKLGSQLAIVSKDPNVHFHARQAGIPVFKTKSEAQKKPWRRSWRYYQRKRIQKKASKPRKTDLSHSPRKENRPPAMPLWKRLGIFTIGVIAVLAIAILLFPSATVRIQPRSQWTEHTLQVQGSVDTAFVHVSGLVPIQEVVTNLEKRATVPSSGSVQIPDTFATGTVIFSNLTSQAITIPRNTILSTTQEPPTHFVTTSEVIVPAGLGEEVEANVKARKPGVDGNQAADTISAIGSSLGASLKVTNPKPTTGGADVVLPAPSAYDRQTLTQEVLEELEASALDSIRDKISPDDVLLSEVPLIKEIELQRYSPPEGQPGGELELTMRVQFSAWVARGEDLRELGEKTLAASQARAGYQPLPSTLQIRNLTEPVGDDGAAWRVLIMWQNQAVWNESEIARLLAGRNPQQAQELLKAYEAIGEPMITLNPSWWPWLPFLPFRVTVSSEQ